MVLNYGLLYIFPVEEPLMNRVMKLKREEHRKCVEAHECPTIRPAIANVKCENGEAGEYQCKDVDLLSFLPLEDMGCAGDGNDIWGWTDPDTKSEYAIVGCNSGTSFVDVTDPDKPVVMGFMETETSNSMWRDIKVSWCVHALLAIII